MITQISIVQQQLDVDALNFIAAAGITNQTQVLAINNLAVSLKLGGVWAKCKAIYPFVGGTALTHRWNLKDPRDLDAAFRLVFVGGWTHSSNGGLPNGTTAYADSKFNPRTQLSTSTLAHLSYYSRSNTAFALEYVMGAADATGNLGLIARRDTNQQLFVADFASGTSFRGASNTSSTNGAAFFLGTQQGSNIKLFRNNTLVASNTTAASNVNPPNLTLGVGGFNLQGRWTDILTNKQCAFASIGEQLTDAECTTMWNAVNQFQITLGRNV